MFLKILKKDLKRKKSMNIVLFILIALASTLVASSTNLMYSTTTAIDSFISKSKVADYNITVANTPESNQKIEAWATSFASIDHYYTVLQIPVLSKNIKVPVGRKNVPGNTGFVLATLPKDVNLVFGQDNVSFNLQDGEIGLPMNVKNTTGLELGDSLSVQLEGISKTFTVTTFFKDAYMGSDLLGLKRLMISQQDYAEIEKALPAATLTKTWSFVQAADGQHPSLAAGFSKIDLPITFEIDKDLVGMSYMTDRIISAMLFVISLFLIFIAFLTLRFTIVSTLQDDYKEIGVMKAIGFKNTNIRRLYFAKYLGLSVVGGAVGLGISIPLTKLMSLKISEYIIVENSIIGILVSIGSAVAIVAITLLFCLLCMRKINKASAIDAIRQGHTGERFKASRKIHLHKSKFLHPIFFLAISDVLNRLKGYTPLILTFILSTAIIIIPINLTNTILTPKFISYFGVTQADFYTKSEVVDKPISEIEILLTELNQEFHQKNFDVTLSADYSISTKYISDNGVDNRRISGIKSESSTSKFEYLDGVAPKLRNEVAITSVMSDQFEKTIGDNIILELDDRDQTFLITGIFQTLTNEGYMVRLSDDFEPINLMAYQFMGNINAAADKKPQILADMKAQLPDLEIKSPSEVLEPITGGFMGQLNKILVLITAIVCLIIFFITSLFIRLLIAKEVQGIAVMKSIGFSNGIIRLWQSLRILILLVASIVAGVFVANLLGERIIGMIFRVFGLTKLNFTIVPLQVYVLYPFLILIVVLLAVYTSCGQIRKIQVWNMNEE